MIFNKGIFSTWGGRHSIETDRPKIHPEMGPFDWLLEASALILILTFAGFLLYQYPKVPDTVPTHFNGTGVADEYGDKTTLLMFPGITIFLYILLTILNLIPHKFNYPGKITPENALRQYTLAVRLLRFLKIFLTGLFFYICYSTIKIANHEISGLDIWVIPLILGLVIIPMILYLILATKKRN